MTTEVESTGADEIQDLIRTRIENLRPKLLDLSRRNPLISTRLSSRSNSLVRVVDELPDVLAFHLCNQQKMQFLPLPLLDEDPKDEYLREFQDTLSNVRLTDESYLRAIEELNPKDDDSIETGRRIERELRDRVRADLGMAPRQTKGDVSLPQHALNNGIPPSYDLPDPEDEHEDGRHGDENIQTLLLPDDLKRKLNALIIKCRTWEQETGINVLHAAFGFLEWTEPNGTDSAFAPLVLLPVTLEKKKTREGNQFWVNADGDDTETNFVLAEKLRREFGIDLPKFQGGSIEQYLQEVAEDSPKTIKWRVRRQVAFGVFPSARIAMYNDLDTSRHAFEDNGVVSNLFGGSSLGGTTPFADEYDIDQPDVEAKVPCLVLDADSSQFSTMVDVADGKNLAVEGPPGTGKSQTIVNTIAAAIADGKKVLFVAEKMAALEVVKSRLEAVGLGEFLLPLQAERSTREQVVQSIRNRLGVNIGPAPRDYEAKVEKFRQARSELAAYIKAISAAFGQTGFTVYDVLGKSIATSDLLEKVPRSLQRPQVKDVERLDRSRLDTIREAGNALERAWRNACTALPHWHGLSVLNIERFTADRLAQLAEDAREVCDAAAGARQNLSEYGMESHVSAEDLVYLLRGVETLNPLAAGLDVELVERIYRSSIAPALVEFLDACRRYHDRHAELAQIVRDPDDAETTEQLGLIASVCRERGIVTLDAAEWQAGLTAFEQTLRTRKQVFKTLEPFIAVFPAVASVPIEVIQRAEKLIQTTEHDVLAVRNEISAEPSAATLMRRLVGKGCELCGQRQRLEEFTSVNVDLSVTELIAHVATLRSAGPFRWLAPSFRSAKRAYIAHTRRAKFRKDDAARDLQKLAEWKEAEQSFADDPQARTLFGIHFNGIDTDFDLFDRLVTYYDAVETQFSGLTNREIRKLLKSEALDLLLSIPNILNDSHNGTFSDLKAEIEHAEANLSEHKIAIGKLRALVPILLRPSETAIESLPEVASQLNQLAELKVKLDKHPIAKPILNERFAGRNTNPEQFAKEIRAGEVLREQQKFADSILNLLDAGHVKEATRAIAEATRCDKKAAETIAKLSKQTGISFKEKLTGSTHEEMAALLKETSLDKDGIFAHSTCATARAELEKHGFGWIVDVLEQNNQPLDRLGAIVEAVIVRAMAIRAYEMHGAVLSRYPGAKLDERRSELASLDREIIQFSRQNLRAKAHGAAHPPAGNGIGKKSTWTNMALIENEASKKQRYIPVRELTRRAGKALLELKPCWMMSPLAVAQYLPLGGLVFDLCIIDEASQMPPEDAVGALARCRQAMVVGDTNQLPPTTFFRKMLDDDEANEDEVVLDESILEMANGVFRPARRLRWHYRSRHSSLIGFSNKNVYDNDLIVFPSASESRPDMGVSLIPVQGRYHAGVNSDEATVMINAALRFMRTNPNRSLGIVTLNQKQRDLLLEEMETASSRDTFASKYVENWISRNDGLESFFIKNLENVQGDERDVIFISTVYGPEQPGAPVMQRFGPINGLAGKRRLNVLFSRAKQQIVTFSSMTAADIRTNEHGNPGAYMLKRWLEYSVTGFLHAGEDTGREPDSDFEIFVIKQLQSMGCTPVSQVGVTGYFIDIGVKHPEWPHGYIMGVECDGATYHSSRSARDRDRLRGEVLEKLGWKLHRIWSTDWFNDPNKEAQRLRAAIEARIGELRDRAADSTTFRGGQDELPTVDRGEETPPGLRQLRPTEVDKSLPSVQDVAIPTKQVQGIDYIEVGDTVRVRYLTGAPTVLEVTLSDTRNDPVKGIVHMNKPLGSALIGAEEGDEVEVLVGNFVRKALVERVVKNSRATSALDNAGDGTTSIGPPRTPPKPFDARSGRNLSPDRFYEPEYRYVLQSFAAELIDRVGPVTFRHLSEVITRAHGFQRTGSQIKKQIWAAVAKSRQSSKSPNGETVFWPHGVLPTQAVAFRGLSVDGGERTWEDVPYPEKFGLAIDTISSPGVQDPAAEMATRIGLARLRQTTREELEALLNSAREHISGHG